MNVKKIIKGIIGLGAIGGVAYAAYRRTAALFPGLSPVGAERAGRSAENLHFPAVPRALLQAEGHLPGVSVSRRGA